MVADPTPTPHRPFWQECVLALIAATAAPLAYQAGKTIRQLVLRRAKGDEESAPKDS